jgi:hypothetical protein
MYEENILSFPVDPDISTTFTINKETLNDIYDSSKKVLKQNNNFVTFDIKNNKVLIKGEDHLEFNHDFKATGDFSIKVVYLPYVTEALHFQSGDVVVRSEEETKGFLYYTLIGEKVVSTTVKV